MCTPASVAVCGRAAAGVTCAISNGTTAFSTASSWSSNFDDADSWNRGPEYYATIQFPDLDGDGKADICGRGGVGIVCALSTGASFGTATTWDVDFSDNAGWNGDPAYWATIQFPDINGDGKADVCGRGGGGILCALSDGTKFVTPTAVWSNDFTDALSWKSNAAYYTTIEFPDINGDGKADVCGRGASGVICALSDGTTFVGSAPLPVWENNFSDSNGWASGAQFYGTIQFADIDGDGKADLCGRGGSGIYCGISDGATTFGTVSLWDADFSDMNGWTKVDYYGSIQFPDMDGDQKADVCARSPNGIVCALSNGTEFVPSGSVWTSEYSDAVGFDANERYFATIEFPDVNADGKADVCGRGIAGISCGLSDGTKFLGSQPLPLWSSTFGDTTDFLNAPYWSTIQFPIANGGTCAAKAQPTRSLRWISRFGS
jgi:hypothetical protein